MSTLSFIPKHHREIQDGANKGAWTSKPTGDEPSLVMGMTGPLGKTSLLHAIAFEVTQEQVKIEAEGFKVI